MSTPHGELVHQTEDDEVVARESGCRQYDDPSGTKSENGQTVVTVSSYDRAVRSARCGTRHKIEGHRRSRWSKGPKARGPRKSQTRLGHKHVCTASARPRGTRRVSTGETTMTPATKIDIITDPPSAQFEAVRDAKVVGPLAYD